MYGKRLKFNHEILVRNWFETKDEPTTGRRLGVWYTSASFAMENGTALVFCSCRNGAIRVLHSSETKSGISALAPISAGAYNERTSITWYLIVPPARTKNTRGYLRNK